MPLFAINAKKTLESVEQTNFNLERDLQKLVEASLATVFRCRFVASEFPTGIQHGGRIDTLALSEDGNPVIIEYKRVSSSELVTQSLYYLAWIHDHRGDFEIAARKALGAKTTVDWGDVRVICLAPSYKKYNSVGQLTSETLPSGAVINYTSANNQVVGVSVTWNNGTQNIRQQILSAVTYDPFGAPNAWTWGWSDTTPMTIARDQDGRVSSISSSLVQLQFTYDNASRISRIKDLLSDYVASRQYSYDLMDRVTQEVRNTSPTTTNFAYDLNGNMQSRSGATSASFAYVPQSNRLAQMVNQGNWFNRAYQYDAMGNVLSDGAYSYTFDGAGRRSTTTNGSPAGHIYYNALGQRVRDVMPGEWQFEEHYVYDENQHLLGQYQIDNGLSFTEQETIWLGDIPVATIQGGNIFDEDGNYLGWQRELLRLYTDHRNAVRRMSFAFNGPPWLPRASQVSWGWGDYTDPFGYGSFLLGNDSSVAADEIYELYSLRFPGQSTPTIVPDPLFYNYYRDYDPLTGRYVESDPVGLGGGPNPYAYASGDPVSLYDVFGLLVWHNEPTAWRRDLIPGSSMLVIPGAWSRPVPDYALAGTTAGWQLSSRCECAGGSYAFKEFTVDFAITVHERHSYAPGSPPLAWIQRGEGDHVADYLRWTASGRKLAKQVEDSYVGRSYPSIDDCRAATEQALYNTLQPSLRGAYDQTRLDWDLSGRHQYGGPNQRP
jgi:RHS repeat-associated protein